MSRRVHIEFTVFYRIEFNHLIIIMFTHYSRFILFFFSFAFTPFYFCLSNYSLAYLLFIVTYTLIHVQSADRMIHNYKIISPLKYQSYFHSTIVEISSSFYFISDSLPLILKSIFCFAARKLNYTIEFISIILTWTLI